MLSGGGLACQVTDTAVGYQVVDVHGCDWPLHVQVAEIVFAHAADAPINDAANAPTVIAKPRRHRRLIMAIGPPTTGRSSGGRVGARGLL